MLELLRRPLDPLGEPDQGDDALDLGGDRVQALTDGCEEVAAQDEVLGRVAGDAELGQQDELRAALAGALDRLGDQAHVALDVAHGGVDLGERQAQIGRLGHIPSMASSARRTTLPRVFRQDRKPPRRRGVDLMEAHVEDLCREYGIELVGRPRRAGARSAGGAASWRSRSRRFAARSPTSSRCTRSGTWSAGDAPRPGSSPRPTPGSGHSTTASVEPTPATLRSISRRLRGYLDWARSRQYRRVPPRIPPREHPFWSLLELA